VTNTLEHHASFPCSKIMKMSLQVVSFTTDYKKTSLPFL